MARTIRDEILRWTLAINGDSAKKELFDLENAQRDLLKSQKELEAEQRKLERSKKQKTAAYRELTAKIKENQAAMDANKTRMEALRGEIGITALTMTQLNKRATDLRQQLRHMTPGSAEWVRLRSELVKTERRIGELRVESNRSSRGLRGLADAANRFQALIAGVIGVVVGAILTFKGFTEAMAKVADQEANVMKTTGMTREEVRELNAEFKAMNTRTPRLELMKLAEEAGRLGKTGKHEVMEFVRTANMLKVALGDDLGDEDAIRDVGKLAEQFQIAEKNGVSFGRGMELLGSAINEVSASGANQAGYLVDFMKRVSGIDQQVQIGAPNMIGYAAALDEAGQSAEIAGTLFNKMLPNMFRDPAAYAKIAKMEVKEFTDLLNNDANAAFMALLKGLKGNGDGFTVMAKKMDELQIDGSRAISVLASLANNTDKIADRQKLANDALKEGTSLVNEYTIKNSNFAASWDKIVKSMHGAFINSEFLNKLERIASAVARWIDIPVSQALESQRIQLAVTTSKLQEANLKTETRIELIKKLKDEYPDYLGHLDEERVGNQELFAAINHTNEAFKEKIRLRSLEEVSIEARRKLTVAELDLLKKEKELRTEIETLRGNMIRGENESLEDFGKRVFDTNPSGGIRARLGMLIRSYKSHLQEVKELNAEFESAITNQNKELPLIGLTENIYTTQITEILTRKKTENPKPNEVEETTEERDARIKQERETRDKAFKLLLDQLDTFLKEEETAHAVAHAGGVINAEQYELAKLQTQQAFQMQRLKAQQAYLQTLSADEKDKGVETLKGIAETNRQIAELDIAMKKGQKSNLDEMSEMLDEYLKDVQQAADEAHRTLVEGRKLEATGALANAEREVIEAPDGSVQELEKKKELLGLKKRLELENVNLTWEERWLIEAKYMEALDALDEEYGLKGKERRLQIAEAVLQGIATIQNSYNAVRNAKEQKELDQEREKNDKRKEALERQLAARIISEESYRTQLAKLDDQYRRKEREIKTEQFKRNRAADAIQAGINTAVSVTRVLHNPVLATIAGLTGAAQVAAILATPVPVFAKGKYNVLGTDGNRYNATMSGPVKTGFYSKPTLGLFGEKGKELVLSGPHTRNLEMNYPEIIDAIMATRVPTYSAGRYPEVKTQSQTVVYTDPQLLAAIQRMNQIMEQGIEARMDYFQHKKFTDNAKRIEEEFNA